MANNSPFDLDSSIKKSTPQSGVNIESNSWRNLALQFDAHRMQAMAIIKRLLADPDAHRAEALAFISAAPLSGEKVLEQRLSAMNSSMGESDGDAPKEKQHGGFPAMSIKCSPQVSDFIESALNAGLNVEETTGGFRVSVNDAEADADGRYGYGVDILLSATGSFVSASRVDVDLSLTKAITTLKKVREMFSDWIPRKV